MSWSLSPVQSPDVSVPVHQASAAVYRAQRYDQVPQRILPQLLAGQKANGTLPARLLSH